MKLYVTRHGETGFNAEGRYAGSTDVPLNETGAEQAGALAQKLKSMTFDVVVSSPHKRARQTAEIVCAELDMPYIIVEQFAERNMGVFEGLTRGEAMERYPELWNRRCTGKLDDAPTGGETIRQIDARITEGLNALLHAYADKRVLLICHGMVARCINRYCMAIPFDAMSSFTLGNCEMAEYTL